MRALVLLLLAACVAASCSLFGNYDVEGLPCDLAAPVNQQCLPDAGYVCVRDGGAGICVKAP
ncbi:MAG: hypothetical protein SFW67_04140 [Myxococcaceae bacterium]|nr:hypothetical protein [Myxococcaceae bacterium]